MSARPRQPIALVLIAILALLPLQGALAAWLDSPAGQACDHHQMTDGTHATGHQSHQAKCCKDMQAPGPDGSPQQCDNGCNHCSATGSAAALNDIAYTALPQLRHIPQQRLESGQPHHGRTPLFRPPRTPL